MLQEFNNCQGLICSTDDVEMKSMQYIDYWYYILLLQIN